jgi:uncharacterized protein YjbJ (UPF0337 family)
VLGFDFRSQKAANCAGTEASSHRLRAGLKGPAPLRKENAMKSSTKDEVKGQLCEVKGKTKERWGKLMNDPTLEGKDENTVGRVQERIGQGKEASKNGTAGE